MKNNKLIIIAVIIIVLLAGLFFWNNLRSKKGTSNELTQTQKSEDIEKTEEAELDELSVEGNMVSDGEWLYTWTSEMPQGVKININKAEEELAGETSDGTSTESLTKDY